MPVSISKFPSLKEKRKISTENFQITKKYCTEKEMDAIINKTREQKYLNEKNYTTCKTIKKT